MNYKNILVAVDGSDEANRAFDKACNVAKDHDARLIIANVIDSRSYASAVTYDRTVIERVEDEMKTFLDECETKAKEAGVTNIIKATDYGSPKVKIPKDMAGEFDADLIVCGATGLNAVERFLIGSVSSNITRLATCDVLVVRND